MNREQLAARFPHASASTIARNCDGIALKYSVEEPIKKSAPPVLSDEEKLNKLERDYLAYLRALNGSDKIGVQDITLLLAHRCRYTADFSLWSDEGSLTLFETKGAHMWEDSWIKLKMAAKMFKHIKFVFVKRERGLWRETIVPR